FAMGSGTDIAKEAADIVITDDNFKSITKAVLYGRTIFESIRKFIVFQLTMNLCAMGISLIGPFVGIENPVTVIQMLWVNIIMDTLGGLAFAGEPALESYMKRKSRSLNEKILNKEMFSQIFITGGYSLTLCIFFIKNKFVRAIFEGKTEIYFLTVFFAMLIFCGIFNSFNARTPSANILSHIAGNKAFLIIMTAVAIIQIMIIYFGGEIFRCVPIDRKSLLIAAMFAFSVIPADILRKLITKKGS
ncbi:MAG: cation transporting ATPase C-terminal domain-containing protein, partial [Clostridia bacterium]|nr:cation transporting ATPase C-terminal domain-containing protein [Clostridia bacterium]